MCQGARTDLLNVIPCDRHPQSVQLASYPSGTLVESASSSRVVL